MPSTGTSNYGFEKQARGEGNNTWGGKLNAAFDAIDDVLGRESVVAHDNSIGGITLTDAQFVRNQSRAKVIKITGTLSEDNRIVNLPDKQRSFIIWNAASRPLVFKAGSGRDITLPINRKVAVITDGAGNIDADTNWADFLKVENLSFDNKILTTNLPDRTVVATQGSNESLSSAFGDVTGINGIRLPNNHQIDGAVSQLIRVVTFELSDVIAGRAGSFQVNESNTVVHDVRMSIVNKNSGRVEPIDRYFWVDSSFQLRKFSWWYDANTFWIDNPNGDISTRIRFANGRFVVGTPPTYSNYELVVHVFGGRY